MSTAAVISTPAASMPAPVKSATKSAKPSKVVVLHVASDRLSAINPTSTKIRLGSKSKTSNTAASTPAPDAHPPPADSSTPTDHASDNNATPVPPGNTESTSQGKKRKSAAADLKSSTTAAKKSEIVKEENGVPKPKGKPGPKRRKLDGDNVAVKVPAGSTPTAAHKLGPKANQGAINAGLRALDRTGKPSRRWHRRGFLLKSFTGVSWALPCWETPKLSMVELNGDSKSGTPSSSDVNKQEPTSSAVGSDKSVNGADIAHKFHTTLQPASSPPAPKSTEKVQ